MKDKLYYIFFGIGLAATIDYNGLNNPTTKMIAMACFAMLCAISIVKYNPFSNKIFRPLLGWYFLACIINLVYSLINDRVLDILNQDILLPIMVTYSSYSLFNLDRNKYKLFFLPICIFSAYCAIKTILQGIGSFSIYEYGEVELAKNQIGAAYTTIAIICVVFAVEKQKLWLRLTYIGLSVLNLYPAIFFGCRTAQICYLIVVLFLLYRAYGWKIVIMAPVLLLLSIILADNNILSFIYDSFVGNRDVSDADSLTSGRLSNLSQSIDYFLYHPFWGFYGSTDGYNVMPHNAHIFIMLRLTKWGIFGAIPFLAMYIYFLKIFIRSIKSKDLLVMSTLLIAYVESFAEYAPPFGPGSCFIPVFFIVGSYLKQTARA